MAHHIYPPLNRITDTCENISFPTWSVIKVKLPCAQGTSPRSLQAPYRGSYTVFTSQGTLAVVRRTEHSM